MRGKIAVLAAAALVGAGSPASARPQVAGHSERLAARARRGDRVARATLVEEHMGLVRSVAFRYRDLGLPLDDLVQEGAIGLLTAIDEYDPGRGTSFSTYAYWRIRAAVTHAITARGSLVRIPRPVRERRRRVAIAQERLAAAGGSPSVSGLAAVTALGVESVAEALAPRLVDSLDRPQPDGTLLADGIPDERNAEPEALAVTAEQVHALRQALQRLRPSKRAIVMRHFGIDGKPETLREIAEDLHLSAERTRALKDEALHDLALRLGPA
jgi:RNA polymerase sigma factor (sigma-70 family)